MRYILTPTLRITLIIVLATFAPRIAEAENNADAINFVSVLETPDFFGGNFCWADVHRVDKENAQTDAKEELESGMTLAAVNEGTSFRGIMREDKVLQRGIDQCGLYRN